MKAVRFLTMPRLFMLLILSVMLPVSGHSSYVSYVSNLLSWTGWGSSFTPLKTSELISKMSFMENSPPLHLVYDLKTTDDKSKPAGLEKNQLYVSLDSKAGDIFHFCFRTPPSLSTEHFPSPPVITKASTEQGMPDIQAGKMRLVELTPDSSGWQHEYLARWRLPAGKSSLVLSVQDNTNQWSIQPDCSGIFSEHTVLTSPSSDNTPVSNSSGSKKRSFVDIFFRTPQAPENEFNNLDDTSHSNTPFAIPGTPDVADNSEPYANSGGGGFGGGDDLDDLFKKRPGGGIAPLFSFELMSKLVSSVVLVRLPDANGQLVKKRVWDTRIVLKIKRGWNEQNVLISQQLWDKIRGANLERNSGLFLALLRSPNNPEAAFDHYLSNNPQQTEDYRGYAEQEFILSPKQLRSVSVFPGSCPEGIGCPTGTETIEKGVSRVNLNAPPSYSQSQADYLHQKRHAHGGRGNGEDDGSGGAPNTRICQNCQKNRPVFYDNMCFDCANAGMVAFEQNLSGPPPIVRNKEIPVAVAKVVDTSAIKILRWLVDLVYEGRELNLFHHSIFYHKYELYNLLTESFLSHKETLERFHKYWVKFSRGQLSAGSLILQVGALANNHGIDKHTEVARIVKTLARHRDIFETKDHLDKLKENRLENELTGNNLVTHNELYNLVYSRVDNQKIKELIDFIYQIFKQTSDLLTEKTVPSTKDTFTHLGTLSRELNRDYGFGFPVYNDGMIDIKPWGMGLYTFITQSNRYRLERNIQSQTLHGLGFDVSDNNPSTPEQVKAIVTGLAILSSTLSGYYGFTQKLSQDQRELFVNFSKLARKELVNFLESTSSDQKNAFISSMFFVFGEIPRELADELTQEQPPTLVRGAQAPLQASAHRQYEQTTGYTLDSPLPKEIFTDYGYKIGTNWKMFARRTEVDFEEYQLDAIDTDNRQVTEKVMKMLNQWKQRSRRPITFRDFLYVLKKIDRNDIRNSIEKKYNLPQI